MADGIRATPYSSSFAGTANDLIGGLLGYMRDPRRTQQMQGLAGLLEGTGIPKTVERLAYGQPLTNIGQANVPMLKPETAEAFLTLLPVPVGANKAAKALDPVVQRYGPKLEQTLLPAFESAYNRGGVTREMVKAMGTGVQSNIISPSEAMKVIGGTKILSDDGLPQMVYRGASSKYDPLTNNISEASKSADTGMWFSGSAPVANTYSGKLGHVSPAYLDMKNPLVVDAKGGMWHDIPTKQLEDLMNVHVPKATVSSDFIARLAKSRGYDGVHFKNMIDPKMDVFDDPRSMNPSDVFVNFNPQSVYSAISDKRIAPTSLLGEVKNTFETSVTDASEIFGEGAKRIKYTDPNSGGVIDVLQRPDGTASVLGLEVPEQMRGQGIGQSLQSQVMQDFPEMMGQVSSRAAAKTAYRLGRRPPNQPDATLDDVYKIMDEYSSVNLVSPDMQKRMKQSLLD